MREMSTDRPDQTESAYTDAGHFQVEMDFAKGTFDTDRSNGGKVRSRTMNFGSVNLKAGLLNNVDIQFVLDPYVDSRIEDRVTRTVEKASGFGDVETRLKINLWGNDGGRTALAIMPFVKWPLPESGLRNGRTEGGVIIPLAIELPAGWSTTVMTEFDFVRNDGGGYDTEFVNSVTLAHDIGISRKEADAFIRAYFDRYPKVRGFIDASIDEARKTGMVRTMMGRLRRLPDIQSKNVPARLESERQAVNTRVQGSAADLIKKAMVDLDHALRARKLKTRLISQIHDELLLETPEAEQETALQLVRKTMSEGMSLLVPLDVDAKVAKNWAGAH